jgi:hypothetical protein
MQRISEGMHIDAQLGGVDRTHDHLVPTRRVGDGLVDVVQNARAVPHGRLRPGDAGLCLERRDRQLYAR